MENGIADKMKILMESSRFPFYFFIGKPQIFMGFLGAKQKSMKTFQFSNQKSKISDGKTNQQTLQLAQVTPLPQSGTTEA